MSKTVPLVIYRNGRREVIGEAEVYEDENGWKVNGRVGDADIATELGYGVGEFSIGPVVRDQLLSIDDFAPDPEQVAYFRANVPIRFKRPNTAVFDMSEYVSELSKRLDNEIDALYKEAPKGAYLCVHEMNMEYSSETPKYIATQNIHVIPNSSSCESRVAKTQYGPKE